MSFLGADTDGLDDMAQQTESAGDAADAVAKALEALVAALEAMSWTGFAAAFAAYLKATVIPWVKVTAQALHTFSKVLSLASGGQKEVSAGGVPVATGSTPTYTTPQLPTTSTGTGPQLAPLQITITVSQGSNGASGVQVSAPTMPGSTGAITGSTGATGTAGSSVSAPPVSYTPATPTSAGTAAHAATVAIPSFTPTSTGSLGSGSTGGGGSAGAAGDGGSWSGSGAGAAGGSAAGAAGGNPTASFGVHTLPGGGVGYTASISGTIGAPDPTSTPVVGAGSGGLGASGATLMPTVPSSSGGTSAAALAAPWDSRVSVRPASGALRAGTSTTPATTTLTTPTTTPAEHWQAQLTTDEHGGARLLLHQAVDPLTAGANPDALLPSGTGPQAWIDADGDYGFSDAGTTVDGVTTHTVVEGNLVTNPDAAPAVTAWWDQALDGTSVQVTTPATPATTSRAV